MGDLTVYSFKVDKERLDRAKRFFDRQGTPLQHSMRDLVDVAADCERCIELHEEDASLSEIQSAFATLLASCKATSYMSSLLQDAVMKIAQMSKVPLDFINNVLVASQRVKPAVVRRI